LAFVQGPKTPGKAASADNGFSGKKPMKHRSAAPTVPFGQVKAFSLR
jgi:hypothetical protein